jgi:hypothetical protein
LALAAAIAFALRLRGELFLSGLRLAAGEVE